MFVKFVFAVIMVPSGSNSITAIDVSSALLTAFNALVSIIFAVTSKAILSTEVTRLLASFTGM